MDIKLTKKTAIITGGASGIGLAIARLFSQAGAAVEILDVDEHKMIEAAAEIHKQGGVVATSVCDVANAHEVDDTISRIRARCGRIDILVNNAGIAHVGNALTTSQEAFEHVQRVNVVGVANCLRSTLRVMAEDGRGGVVLNLASCLSIMGARDRFAYSASKGSVLAMTYSVAKDFLEDGIRCNALLPGRVHTPFVDGYIAKNYPGREEEMFEELSNTQPMGRMGRTREIAAAALFLCSEEASFITGTGMPIDGGLLTIR